MSGDTSPCRRQSREAEKSLSKEMKEGKCKGVAEAVMKANRGIKEE